MDLEKMKALATEAKALADHATEGPWRVEPGDDESGEHGAQVYKGGRPVLMMAELGAEAAADAAFIARARTAVPELADAVLKMAAEIERLRASAAGPAPAVLFGGQAKMLRALAVIALRLAQLHGQKAGAHEALVEAETDLARVLGFVPRESAPLETNAFDEDPACPDA